jgi:hypothetical protein
LKLTIKLAVDEGEFDRAAELIEVAKKTRPTKVTSLEVARVRRDVDGAKT